MQNTMVILKNEREPVGHVFHSVCSTSSQSHVGGSTFSFNSRALADISLLKRTRSQRKKRRQKGKSFKNASTVCHSRKQMLVYTGNVFNIWSETLPTTCCLLASPGLFCQLIICLTFWYQVLFLVFNLFPAATTTPATVGLSLSWILLLKLLFPLWRGSEEE